MNKRSEMIVFDDWNVRDLQQYKSRIKDYKFLSYMFLVFDIVLLIAGCFNWYAFVGLFFLALVEFGVYLEWLKTKNYHLIIKENSIEITNRFKKTVVYDVDYSKCSLILTNNFARGGGIYLTFVDSNNKKICRYEDMINNASYLNNPLNSWEKGLKSLGIPIIDEQYIFKNNLHNERKI